MTYLVYKISGANTKATYYGYVSADNVDNEQEIVNAFMRGATRQDLASATRGDVMWLDANDGEQDNVTATIVDICDTEIDAWMSRNEERERDGNSITGASILPIPKHIESDDDKVQNHLAWYHARKIGGIAADRHDFSEMGDDYLKCVFAKYGKEACAGRRSLTVAQFKEKFTL